MAAFSVTQIALVTGALSLAYVAFGAWVIRRYEGIGVWNLGAFAALWGLNFLVASLVIYLLASYGITAGTQLTGLSRMPTSVQLVLISSTPLSGLLSVGGIFAWVWFVLGYTRRIGRNEKVGLAVLGGGVFLVATLNGLVGALSAFGFISIPSQLEASFHDFASIVEVLGTGVAVGVGVALLYTTSREHRPFTTVAVVGLSVPIVVLYLVRYVYQFALVPGFRAIGVLRIAGLLVGLAGLWLTVTREGLFEQLPASRTVGRQTAFDATDTAIVVVNNDGNVADLNPAARELFDIGDADVVGTPLAELLPGTVDVEEFDQPRSVSFGFPNSDRVVEAETTHATDDNGRAIGRTIVFNEITGERRRQQRIQVLNRVLRHNLRNDVNAASGYIDVLTDGGDDVEQYRDRAKGILNGLVTIGKKARDIEQVLAADPLSDGPSPLADVVEEAVESVRADYDDVAVTVNVPPETTVRINRTVLQAILAELIENAVEHGDANVIDVEYDTDRAALIVADDGPGIPDHEIEVLDSARETALEHGSGLGLWLVKWGTDMFGGTVTFETEGSGTRAVVELPTDLVDAGERVPEEASDQPVQPA
jgi:signal transduction histidine kinase